jgi:hypothetical protein
MTGAVHQFMRCRRMVWLAAALAAPLLPGAATAQVLRGTVIDEATGGVVAAGEVMVLATDRDTVLARGEVDRGAFYIELPAPGVYRLRAIALGYQTVTSDAVTAPPATVVTVELRTRANALPLEPLIVVAERREPFWLDDIRERQRQGGGSFLYREELDIRASSELADVLRSLAGVDIEMVGTGSQAVPYPSMRRAAAAAVRTCHARLFLNGHPLPKGSDLVREFMNTRPADIEAIEVYRGPAQTPGYYAIWDDGECGVVAMWLRTGYDPPTGEPKRFLPMPQMRLSAGRGRSRVAGPYAPAPGSTMEFTASWILRPGFSLAASGSSGEHVLDAATTWDLTLRPAAEGYGGMFRLPPGERPLRLLALSLGPRLEPRIRGPVKPHLEVQLTAARRSFSVPSRYPYLADMRFSSWGWGITAGAGVSVPVISRLAMSAGVHHSWLDMRAYERLDFPDRTTAADWRAAGFAFGLAWSTDASSGLSLKN